MPKITPFLWFNTQAEQAAKLYTSIFKNSKIVKTTRFGNAGPDPKGSVMTVVFTLDGLEFTALNGGPQVHGGHIVRRELQDAGRSGHLLGTYAFLRAEKKASAAGLRTNLVFPGRSFPRPWASC